MILAGCIFLTVVLVGCEKIRTNSVRANLSSVTELSEIAK